MGRVKEAAYAWPPVSQAPFAAIYEKPIIVSEKNVSTIDPLNEIASSHAAAINPFGQAAGPNQMVTSNAAGMQQTQSWAFSSSQQHVSSIVHSHLQVIQPANQQLPAPVFPPSITKSNSQSSSNLLSPLSGGGFIFNYPPMYSEVPMPPFSRPMTNDVQMITPSSPISSPLSESVLLSPGSPLSPISYTPTSPQFSNGISVSSSELRKEKLEKYRQKRTKRNFNRPVDQARRERAQARPRDEFGHFLSPKKDVEKERMQVEMIDVKTQLETWMKESQLLKDRLFAMEHKLQEQEQLNNDLLHENRILWSTIPATDVFNTLRPGTSFIDAFKEKVDLSNVELNFTDSPYLEGIKLEDLVNPDLDFTSGSLS